MPKPNTSPIYCAKYKVFNDLRAVISLSDVRAVEYLAAIQRKTYRRNDAHQREGADNSRRPGGPTLTTTKLRLLIYTLLSLPYDDERG